jgi:RimJ/RimL family protein N-acetyltransferase
MPQLEPPDLRTDAFLLRPWRLDDLDQLVAELQDPEIPRWTRVPEPYTGEDGREFLERTADAWSRGTSANFAIVDVASAGAQLLGSIGAIFHEDGAATIGYWVARGARGRGIASDALRLVSRWVIESFEIERVELVTAPDNVPSQRVAEKAGFTRAGLLRRYVEIKGKRRDCVMFSLLPEDLGL